MQCHSQSSKTVSCNNNNDENDDPNMQREMYSDWTSWSWYSTIKFLLSVHILFEFLTHNNEDKGKIFFFMKETSFEIIELNLKRTLNILVTDKLNFSSLLSGDSLIQLYSWCPPLELHLFHLYTKVLFEPQVLVFILPLCVQGAHLVCFLQSNGICSELRYGGKGATWGFLWNIGKI